MQSIGSGYCNMLENYYKNAITHKIIYMGPHNHKCRETESMRIDHFTRKLVSYQYYNETCVLQ